MNTTLIGVCAFWRVFTQLTGILRAKGEKARFVIFFIIKTGEKL